MKEETKNFLEKTYGTAGLSLKQGLAIDISIIVLFLVAIWIIIL